MNVPSANILVIDDDESIRLGCTQTLLQESHRVRAAANGREGLDLAREEAFDLAVVDLRMPELGGMEVLDKLHEESPDTRVIIMTGYATIDSAVEAIRRGAYDYLPKPFTPDMLTNVATRALERRRLSLENLALRAALKERDGREAMVGSSPPMQAVFRLIQKVAPTDATVLVIGETGVGKELVARAIHQQSPRRDRPFIAVDCAALVKGLFESELFGHVRGAYTGAVESTIGKFELAQGGTLFLDEIGNVSPEMQVKLLRVLQEREITKVGGTQRIKVDVRIVAATNSDLLSEMRTGAFREDLFYRLSVVPIRLPPLRERREDIVPLANHFLARYAPRRNRAVTGFTEPALQALQAYEWPGNVREVENTIERALIMAESSLIRPTDLFFYGPVDEPTPSSDEGHLADVEKRAISEAMTRFGWQMARAADFLGINRKTLREKIRRYGLNPS